MKKSLTRRNDGLVYSSAPVVPEQPSMDSDSESFVGEKPRAIVGIERKRRGGKTVTIIEIRGKDKSYIESLAKNMRKLYGTGGTTRGNIIELSGDLRQQITQYLKAENLISSISN